MYSRYIKRMMDLIGAVLMMPFFVLLTAIIGPLIYFEDHGPIFFRQTRRGIKGCTYKIIKYRTMKVNSPQLKDSEGSTLILEKDQRITKIGAVLRQWSLDEIPQIVNVLLGEMSFIGPRPTLATDDFESYSPIKKKRLEVRPGLTGYSQAYYRNSITAKEKFIQDVHYVDHIGLAFDLKILFQTIIRVVLKKDVNANEINETNSTNK